MTLQLKRATGIMNSQRVASIALSVIGCIDYLANGTIFTRAMFLSKKIDVFFPARKAADERWGVVVQLGLQFFQLSQHWQPKNRM
jgi:hypothetical protein